MIRHATSADTEAIVSMAQHFGATPEYATLITISPDAIRALTAALLENPQALILLAEDATGTVIGMFVAIVFPHLMSGELLASEIAWWMEPTARGEGVKMLRQAETWAVAQGATILQLVAPTPRVERFYDQLGYIAVERAYQKRLT